MHELDVAVIIVNYRSASLTLESLGSVQMERGLSGLRIGAIVVDNASGDAPMLQNAIAERGWQGWVQLIAAPRNGGFAYGNNLGLRCAYTGQPPAYLYLLNPDTQVRPGAIAALVTFLESHPRVGIVGGSFEDADGSDWPIAFRFPTLASEVIQGVEFGLVTRLLRRWDVPRRMGQAEQAVDWVSGAAMMVRRAVIDKIGGLDENYFLYFEETDFCRRARLAGFATWYIPASRVMHMRGGITRLSDHNRARDRLPGYWFESRRRYFVTAHGFGYAMLVDVVALLAHMLGWIKRVVLRRRHRAVPHFARDLMRSSVIWPRNRRLSSTQCFLPPG